LVAVCQDGRYTGVVEFDVFVVHLDEADCGVGSDQRLEGRIDGCRDKTLEATSVSIWTTGWPHQ